MKNKTTLCLLLATSLFSGCEGKRKTLTELSDIIHERARVSKYYRPTGLFRSEEYSVLFDGKIDFQIDDKGMYDTFEEGETVEVSYRIIHELRLEDLNHYDPDSIQKQVERRIKNYIFISADAKRD